MKYTDLSGKKAIVTGGSKGIGRAVALALAEQGAEIIVVSRNLKQAQTVVREIEDLDTKALAVSVDVSDREQVERLMRSIVPAFGGLDIFINNAGITVMKHLTETTPEEVDGILATNLKGAINCLTYAAQIMINQNRGGNIVLLTSINAMWPLPGQAVYSATKSALETLMRCLASDLAPYGIRVNSLAPGAINTDMNSHFTPETLNRVNSKIALGRVAEPEELGGAVCFLVSEAAGYVTGTTLVVDGGFMLRS